MGFLVISHSIEYQHEKMLYHMLIRIFVLLKKNVVKSVAYEIRVLFNNTTGDGIVGHAFKTCEQMYENFYSLDEKCLKSEEFFHTLPKY